MGAFIREIAFISQFRHPNIIEIEDVCFDDFLYFSQALGVPLEQAYDSGMITDRDYNSVVRSFFFSISEWYLSL